jgi:hypothetical protein
MGFHEVPWNSMRFYDVLVNRSVPTEANRGLTSYRQEGRGLCLTLIALFPKALEYNFGVPRAYMSHFKGLKDEFCREGRLPGAPEQCKEVVFLDGQHPLRFKEVNIESRGVVRGERFKANNVKWLQSMGTVR